MKDIDDYIDNFVNENEEEAVSLLKTLSRIPAPTRHEERRAEFIYAWLLNLNPDHLEIDEAKNVICIFRAHGAAADISKDKYVVLAAHTDIVFDDTDDIPLVCDGDILRAPGIGDDTACLVQLLYGAKFTSENKTKLNENLMFVANSCEEGLGNLDGTKAIFQKYRGQIKEYQSFDCYLPSLISIPVGSARYKIIIRSEGGHSFREFGAVNAIHVASLLICQLYNVEVPFTPRTTYNVGLISGGTTVNSIAQNAEFLYEYRSSDQKCLDIMKEKFDAIISDFQNRGYDIRVELLGIRPGMGNVDREALKTLTSVNADIIRKYAGREPDMTEASTDSNIPLSLGIPANTIGTISGGSAHTREEWIDLHSMITGMKIVMAIVGKYIKKKPIKHKTFEERLAEYNGEIPICDFEWGEPVGKEIL